MVIKSDRNNWIKIFVNQSTHNGQIKQYTVYSHSEQLKVILVTCIKEFRRLKTLGPDDLATPGTVPGGVGSPRGTGAPQGQT